MSFFSNKGKSINDEFVNKGISIMRYKIDCMSKVYNYHRIFAGTMIPNIASLINPAIFPGFEKFKFQVNMMEKMSQQVKEFNCSHALNFNHNDNMKMITDTLDKAINNLKKLISIYGDSLCVDFDGDIFSHQHREIIYRLFGECTGCARVLDAETKKLELEFYALYDLFTGIIPNEKLTSLENMFKSIMELRYSENKES